ncbi:long-chain fatty acid--CoA ligase [Burkholderia sp. Bp8963]|uniref:AMP-binding protein n=1 Tax=Burkholderia sp. Bp8963 TaxID=2184547 RepID=UPI000F59CBA6|nr:AMP-binding protein [Burkholderia sp. Bp8963]RQS66006.1 long-chain fatty acid--CoA ligase [Burkholderia sp. Bp8963]
MEARHWHVKYPPGMPVTIDLAADETLARLLERSFSAFREQPAVLIGDERLSYAQLDQYSRSLATHLQRAGLRKGDRVALLLGNCVAFPVVLAAALRSGLIAVPVNPLYTARELDHQLRDASVRAIVLVDSLYIKHRPLIEAAGVALSLTLPASGLLRAIETAPVIGHSAMQATVPLAEVLAQEVLEVADAVSVYPEDPALLQYTGGTTGLSKGAILTHRAMSAGILQSMSWFTLAVDAAELSVVAPLPLYHIYPLHMLLLMLRLGGVMRLVANPRDTSTVIAEMKRAPFGVFIGVNTLFNSLVQDSALQSVEFDRTRLVVGAGASVQRAVAECWSVAGAPPITEAYGLTETSPAATFNPVGHSGDIGIPLPSTDVRVINDEGQVVPDGTPGELLIKGPQLFSGYWKREEETRKVMTDDGFFRTGDIVVADATGNMRIVDRKKDMILVSGFNVYPNEIEAVVALHEGVLECACVGEPDEKSGEVPHLYLVPKKPDLRPQDIEQHCRANLAAYKVPKYVTFVDALPKSTVGKILRRELRVSK